MIFWGVPLALNWGPEIPEGELSRAMNECMCMPSMRLLRALQ